jgi:Tol biopolymer transport system component
MVMNFSRTRSIIAFVSLFAILSIPATSYPIGSPVIPPASAEENPLATPKTMIDAKMLRELDHSPEENSAYRFKVLDWSPNGKFILFGYYDYADPYGQMNSLGIIDVQTFNITKLDVLTANENNTKEIYLAKISPSSYSIFVLIGKTTEVLGGPEDIFEYDLATKTLSQITNSSDIYWFDTLGSSNKDKTLAYIDFSGLRFWPVDDAEAGTRIDNAAGLYYPYMSSYGGRLDLNDDATKMVFTGGPFDSRGIIYVDISSGKTTVIRPRDPCVSSVEFAPYEELLVYSERPGQECLWPEDANRPALRLASLDGTIDEVLYVDTEWANFDVVLSPDGKYAASFDYGSEEGGTAARIMLLQLPRPVPEFGSYIAIAMVATIIAGTLLATRLKPGGR